MPFFVIFAGMRCLSFSQRRQGPASCRSLPAVLLLALLPILLLTGCQPQEVCEEATDSSLRIGFYSTENNNEVSRAIDSLSVYGIGRSDSLIYNNTKNVSRIELPLDANNNQCSFVLVFPGANDTIRLEYTQDLNLVSVECGFVLFYNITGVNHTGNYIIRAETHISEVTNSLDEHIKLFVPAPADN